MHTRKTFCRFCHANCAIEVDIEDDRAVAVRGDVSDPLFGGYTCMKGRELPAQASHPDRLRSSQRRQADGTFVAIPSRAALDEIASRLAAIRERHGARSIATYCGTYGFMNSAALPVALGFHQGIGSPSFYTSITIDQPAKVYLGSRVGSWLGGRLADRFGRRRPALLGRGVALLGTLPLLTMDEGTSPLLLGFWLLVLSLGSGLSTAAVQEAAVESAPRRFSGMATGVFTTAANLGGIIGIALTSVALGDNPDLAAFQTIFTLYVITTLVGSAITTRIEPWPASEDDAQPVAAEE